jgi:RimJ/RimL family protein N-acetyltransferase
MDMRASNIWEGKAVRLRAVEAQDWEPFFEAAQDTEIARHSDEIGLPSSREGIRKWAAELAAARPEADNFRWVIERLDGEFVGTINTHHCDRRNGTFQYGLAIRREHWRKGYASEAVRLILAYYFRELRYQKVNAHVSSFNKASRSLHKKLGFRQEGRLRRMVYTQGKYYDDIIYGLTAEEFAALESPPRTAPLPASG